MALNDIYQIRVEYHDHDEEDMVNVFYYQQTASGTPGASGVSTVFLNSIWNVVRAAQPAATITDKITVVNGMDNADSFEGFPSTAGTSANSGVLPSFVAAAFRNPRPKVGDQYSYKRIGGLAYDLNSTDGQWNAAMQAALGAVALVLNDTVTPSGVAISPCQITGPFRLGVIPTFARLLTSPWQLNLTPTTQNTRKSYQWVTPS